MNTETINSVNNNFDINTLAIGTKFTRILDGAKGELTQGEKRILIRFEHPKTNTFHTVPFSDKWRLTDIQTVNEIETAKDTSETAKEVNSNNLLDKILDENEKGKGKSKAAPKTPNAPKFEELSESELTLRKELEKEFKALDSKEKKAIETVNSTPFAKAKIIRTIQKDKLFRDKFTRFEDYAIEVLKVERAYATNLAQIGEFANITERFFERDNLGLSIKAANQFIRNNNKLIDTLNMPEKTPLGDFENVLDKVISITGEVGKKEGVTNVTLTPKVVDCVANEVTKEVESLVEYKGKDILSKVASILDKKRSTIIANAKEAITAPAPKLELSECNHLDGKAEIVSNIKGVLTLSCKCVFKRIS